MLERFQEVLRAQRLVTPGDQVVVAVSGGPDSVALLHLLHRSAPAFDLSLHIFHLDHGLRGEASAADADWVAAMAVRLGLPATIERLPPGRLKGEGSLQAAARRLRYESLLRLARRLGAQAVATGHNRDDQAETLLMRLLRGAGTRGLAAIPPRRVEAGVAIIRPLLAFARAQIEEYCAAHELFPRMDDSNAKGAYRRNRIRLELMPLLRQQYNPAIEATLAQTADLLREDESFLTAAAEAAFQRCRIKGAPTTDRSIEFDGPCLAAEHPALARRVVRQAARMLLGPAVDLGLDATNRVLALATRTDGTHLAHLPGGLTLTVQYGRCRLERGAPTAHTGPHLWPVAPDGETALPALRLTVQVDRPDSVPAVRAPDMAVFDAARLPGPLAIRHRLPGDRIWPVGMAGSKKLQDILVDAKLPREERDLVPLLVAGDHVLWVIGHRLDRRFLAAPDCPTPLRVRVGQFKPL